MQTKFRPLHYWNTTAGTVVIL